MRRAKLAIGPLLAAGAVLTIAGCGGDDQETATPPAALAPAESVFYAESVLRSEGEEREALETSLSTVLGEPPGTQIIEELNSSLAESGFSYEGDLAPWVGERGGLFLTALYEQEVDSVDETINGAKECIDAAEPAEGEDVVGGCAPPPDEGFSSDGVEGAFVIQSTDEDAAAGFVEKVAAESDGAEDAEYEGVEYKRDENGDAVGVVGDFVVLGSEQGFEAAVDAEAGGASLADDDAYTGALGDEEGSTATLYADVPAIAESAEAAGELRADDRAVFESVFGGAAEQPLTASVDAAAGGFGAEFAYGTTDAPFLAAAEESALLRELPGDSWFAAGFSGLGDAVGSLIGSAADFGVAEDEIESTREQFRREYGLELEDFYEPFGDGAFFANGEGIFGTGAGLVVETDDDAAADRLITGLERAARRSGDQVRPVADRETGAEGFSLTIEDAPGTVNFIGAEDRVVIAYGDGATTPALTPEKSDGRLGGSDAFAAASEALGEDFAVATYLDFAPLVDLLSLAAAADPSLQQMLPYLEPLDFLIAGSASDGERERLRMFIGIAAATVEPSA
ncbi:MAG: DUF3352 domain-containing protein [Solirubrobacterales bacterium]